MVTPSYVDASAALKALSRYVMSGDEVGSRLGERTMEALHCSWSLQRPLDREILLPGRSASIVAQVAETMWVLAGRNDVEWLSAYLPRAAEFSDDGHVWRGGYGPRIRNFNGSASGDQVRHVVDLLTADPTSRRAVISIYDPVRDSTPGKDIPCNNWLQFISRLGRLDLHVVARSNDLMWGWSGINQFEWSVLQEIVAHLLGLQVGSLHFTVGSLHIYDRHWAKARELAAAPYAPGSSTVMGPSPRFRLDTSERNLDRFDELVKDWFDLEYHIRRGTYSDTELMQEIALFPEPMLQSWLSVIAYYWTGSHRFQVNLKGTRLYFAQLASPKQGRRKTPTEVKISSPLQAFGPSVQEAGDAMSRSMERATMDPFLRFVSDLHREKGKVYGDSWKKRGELFSIIPNIARKVDRAGVGGAGDTTADTYIDLLVYLLKYTLWLNEEQGAVQSVVGSIYDDADEFARLDGALIMASKTSGRVEMVTVAEIQEAFEGLAKLVEDRGDHPTRKAAIAWSMAVRVLRVARVHWEAEQANGEDHAARNATRSWNPEAGLDA